jgi:hypothetical protein
MSHRNILHLTSIYVNMPKILLNTHQFKIIVEETIREQRIIDNLQVKWNGLNEEEKTAVVELTNIFTKRKDIIKENWLNTLGDIVGIFDPTGIVDLVNGISYFAQGDKLFGTLSMVSAVPYLGDVIAKPLMLGGKAVGTGMKGLKAAMATGKSAEIAKAASKAGGKTAEFVKTADKWSPQVMAILNKGKKVPLVGKFFNRIEDWMKVMTQASKDMKLAKQSTKGILPKSAFRNYGIDTSKNVLSRMWQRGGFIKNKKLSLLLYKSKFWLGFLDWIGIGNFVGPEEFEKQYGAEYTQQAMDSYMSTEKGNKEYKSEIEPSLQTNTSSVEEPKNTQTTGGSDIVNMVFGNMF